jgi:hypothetical protein
MEGALARFAHRHPTGSSPPFEAPKTTPLDLSLPSKHDRLDPPRRPGGRLQIGTVAGFKSESVAGFILEWVAGFVGIRTWGYTHSLSGAPLG